MRIFVLAFVFILAGCSSTTPKSAAAGASGGPGQPKAVVPTAAPLTIAKGSPAILARAITAIGDNRTPRFSPDGSKLLFVSSSRPSHRQSQVYELDLVRMTERRVTFHDGEDEGANWAFGGQKIVYSSDTDEIKEDVSLDRLKSVYEASKSTSAPNGIRSLPRKNAGDIYLQRLDGRDIERLTSLPSRESSPTADVNAKFPRVVFASNQSGDSKLYFFDGKSTKAITHGGDSSPAFSPDGKTLAWVRETSGTEKGSASAQIFMSENFATTKSASPLTSPGFRDLQPSWTSKNDGVLFVSNRAGKESAFDLYLIDRKASCLKRLTEVQLELGAPAMSPDGTKIAFSARVNGQNQIYLMDDRSAALACQPPPR